MKRIYLTAVFSALLVLFAVTGFRVLCFHDDADRTMKIGFLYVGDASTSYTSNFIKAQSAVEREYGDRVETIAKYNVPDGGEEEALQELVDEGCALIFSTSFAYGNKAKEFAGRYPDIQFCQATCANANEEPVYSNYHTFMGAIYQGRYISGVVAGMKLRELIGQNVIDRSQAKVGYIGAFAYPEVISGYTAFFLGVRSVVPEAEMTVTYTNSWSDYALEKKYAARLLAEGCVILSQHSDTAGPAAACEETMRSQAVYHVSYNQSMADIAPTTYLVGCKINWEPYILAAVQAVFDGKKIEDCMRGNKNGNDIGAGFDEGWVQMLELNELIAAEGTKEVIEDLTRQFEKGGLQVFQGDYTGVDPNDETDVCDLKQGYMENENSSAPTFHYVLKDVITVE